MPGVLGAFFMSREQAKEYKKSGQRGKAWVEPKTDKKAKGEKRQHRQAGGYVERKEETSQKASSEERQYHQTSRYAEPRGQMNQRPSSERGRHHHQTGNYVELKDERSQRPSSPGGYSSYDGDTIIDEYR